ncbi:MAG: hypothetical protein AAF957_03965 [Planctomycetota bacterium]
MKLIGLCAVGVLASVAVPRGEILAGDDFQREPRNREVKDPLEGKPAPALQVTGWMNTGGAPLSLESLRGKVVVLDFWGTW